MEVGFYMLFYLYIENFCLVIKCRKGVINIKCFRKNIELCGENFGLWGGIKGYWILYDIVKFILRLLYVKF